MANERLRRCIAVATAFAALGALASCGDPKVDQREVARHVRAAPLTLKEACAKVDDEQPRGVAARAAYAEFDHVLGVLADEGDAETKRAIAELRPSVTRMANRKGHQTKRFDAAFERAVARFDTRCLAAGSSALE